MTMLQAPINLTAYEIEELSLTPTGAWDREEAVAANIGVEFVFGIDNEHEFGARLRITLSPEDVAVPANLPYTVAIRMRGWFQTPLVIDSFVPEPLALNALSILYGTMRGFVGQTTSMMSNGPLVLPAVVFDKMVANAARTAGTAVAPVDLSPRQAGAAEAFGLLYALEDLPRAAAVLPEGDVRNRLLLAADSLKNRMAHEPRTETSAASIIDTLTSIDSDLALLNQNQRTLIEPLVGRLRVGLERLAAIDAAKRNSPQIPDAPSQVSATRSADESTDGDGG